MKSNSISMLAVALAALVTAAVPVAAADLGTRSQTSDVGTCLIMRPSPILELASTDKMEAEVDRRYQHALEVSVSEHTIGNRSPRFAWSTEAKIACGKAIGYFSAREVNADMISKCDCYYGRMLRFTR